MLKLEDDPTLDDVIAAVRTDASSTPAGQWIFGTIGARTLLDPKATRLVLDEAAPGRLVKLAAWTGHGNILNTAALRGSGSATAIQIRPSADTVGSPTGRRAACSRSMRMSAPIDG